jgi:hypothetical protein
MGDVGLMGTHVPGMSWRDIRDAAVLAEALGYRCITMGESWGEDALTSLAQLAAATSRIRIRTRGIGNIKAVLGSSGRQVKDLRVHYGTMEAVTGCRGERRGQDDLFASAHGARETQRGRARGDFLAVAEGGSCAIGSWGGGVRV